MAISIGQSISMAANGLARQAQLNYTASGVAAPLSNPLASSLGSVLDSGGNGEAEGASFGDAMLKALEGVDSYQAKSEDLLQQMVVDPDSVDAQDVTIAMAEANLSLNLAKTILSRVVTAWKDVINTR
jgi:flagellar hook-basal body complex protein FliE